MSRRQGPSPGEPSSEASAASLADTPEAPARRASPPAPPDEKLFRDLVRQHQRRLYAFILKNIGNPSDAEDLAQQAFVEAAASLGNFRGESELSSWLYGIAMNMVRNYLSRAPHRRYSIEDESALESVASGAAGPLEKLESRETVARLERELAELPEEMRHVLLLVALEDLSYEEAAIYLSIPIGTVRSRVSRARQTLRRRLVNCSLPF